VRQILIIDDSEDDCLLIRHILAKGGEAYSVADVSGMQSAIEYLIGVATLQNSLPDLILCDLIMPKQDGFSFLNWFGLQQEFKSVKVALMSGMFDDATIERARACGACACIDKGNLVKNPAPFYEAVNSCFNGEHVFQRP